MLRIGMTFGKFYFSKTANALKLMELKPPTNKQQIKKKYLQLAKQLHPDSKSSQQKKKSEKQQKAQNEAFIQITKAYKYLSSLTEQQINLQKENQQQGSSSNFQDQRNQQEQAKPMTKEERMRRATYAYLNRKQKYQKGQEQQLPIYKRHPQYFILGAIVLLFSAEWIHRAIQSSTNSAAHSTTSPSPIDFEQLNFSKQFNKNKLNKASQN